MTPPSSPESPRRVVAPDPTARWALAAAALVWAGTVAGMAGEERAVAGAVAVGVVAAILRRRLSTIALAAALVLGAAVGTAHERSVEEGPGSSVAAGPVRLLIRASTDKVAGFHGDWLFGYPRATLVGRRLGAIGETSLLIHADDLPELAVGEIALLVGELVDRPGTARDLSYSARVLAHRVEWLAEARNPLLRVGNSVRERVLDRLDEVDDPAAALLSGFLIGDTSQMAESDVESLRAAGLSHFVAVSGSNVALFLAVWWVVVAPFSLARGTRLAAGLVGLALFVTITRWEPSVLRAVGMAAVMLVGRAAGLAISGWTALGAAVCGALLVSPGLGIELGFQLSVAATVGILAGSGMFSRVRPAWVGSALGVTVAAQLAVTPILLAAVGQVPLVSPLTNLVAAPLVAVATVIGGVAVLTGIGILLPPALAAASGVLAVAHGAAGLPQLDLAGVAVAAILGLVALRPSWRALAALAGAMALVVAVGIPSEGPDPPAAVFLDVGQGDSIVLLGASGGVVLVDGGPDGATVLAGLSEHGIRRIDLMVVSHPHEDHVAGLVAVMERIPVGKLWHPGFPDGGATFDLLLEMAADRGTEVAVPIVGHEVDVGGVELEVMGPLRRYASLNDHSLVIDARLGDLDLLLAGDVEETAQRELGPIRAEVLKVAHHGAATSDVDWLTGTGATLAVISVGPNDFGHPSPEIVAAIEASGARVVRTDQAGDILLRPP